MLLDKTIHQCHVVRVVALQLRVDILFVGCGKLCSAGWQQEIHAKRSVADQPSKLLDASVQIVEVREAVAHHAQAARI